MNMIYDSIYYLYTDTISNNDIIKMKNYKRVHINNNKFNDDLNLIPSNIIYLVLDCESLETSYLPNNICHLNIININSLVIIPSNVINLELGHAYINKFPMILSLLPYNIKILCINLPFYQNNSIINLNCLPESITDINIFFWLCESFNVLNLNKPYPNLKTIHLYDANLLNHNEIELYSKNNDIDIKWLKINDYLQINFC
jgi:hypothetical protein